MFYHERSDEKISLLKAKQHADKKEKDEAAAGVIEHVSKSVRVFERMMHDLATLVFREEKSLLKHQHRWVDNLENDILKKKVSADNGTMVRAKYAQLDKLFLDLSEKMYLESKAQVGEVMNAITVEQAATLWSDRSLCKRIRRKSIEVGALLDAMHNSMATKDPEKMATYYQKEILDLAQIGHALEVLFARMKHDLKVVQQMQEIDQTLRDRAAAAMRKVKAMERKVLAQTFREKIEFKAKIGKLMNELAA